MPNMLSIRNFRLETTTGHSIEFKANVPTWVAPVAVPAAMAAGCVPEDAKDQPFYEDSFRDKVEFKGDIRRSMLHVAVKTIAERNDVKEFDGSGNPKTDAVVNRLGFEVTRNEVVDAFRIYMQAKAEDIEIDLHPSTAVIARIIDADDKKDLVELADELDVPKDKVKGLVARDLRKLLLAKCGGVSA